MIITTNLSVDLMVMIAATTPMLIATSIVLIVRNVPLRITILVWMLGLVMDFVMTTTTKLPVNGMVEIAVVLLILLLK